MKYSVQCVPGLGSRAISGVILDFSIVVFSLIISLKVWNLVRDFNLLQVFELMRFDIFFYCVMIAICFNAE